MSDWINVDSRLPDMHEVYKDSPRTSGWLLIYTGSYVFVAQYEETYKKRQPRWVSFAGRGIRVTHWMELPKEPKP